MLTPSILYLDLTVVNILPLCFLSLSMHIIFSPEAFENELQT